MMLAFNFLNATNIDNLWESLSEIDSTFPSLEIELILKQEVPPFLNNPTQEEYQKAYDEFMKVVLGNNKVSASGQKKIGSQIRTKLLDGEKITKNFSIYLSNEGVRFVPDAITLEMGNNSIDGYVFCPKTRYQYFPSRKYMIIDSVEKESMMSNFSYAVFPYTYLASCGRGITVFFVKQNIKKVESGTNDLTIHLNKNNRDYEVTIRKSDYLITNIQCKYNEFHQLDKIRFNEYKLIENTMIPCQILVESNNFNGQVIFKNSFSLTKIVVNKEYSLIPDDFPLIRVEDNRFDVPIVYTAKGQLPSEEKIIAMAADKKLLDEHNLLMRKLSR